MSQATLKQIVEAILFASDEPVSVERLADAAGDDVTPGQVRQAVEELMADYDATGRAFTVEDIAGGLQLFTRPAYNKHLKSLMSARRQQRFTQAALETLAIIAYKQPIMRADVEAIRGVSAGEMIRGLMYKGLVKIVGRAEVVGRPMLYGTTKKFLQTFGLNSLKDLPSIEELKKPSQ